MEAGVRKAIIAFVKDIHAKEKGTLAYEAFQVGKRDFMHVMTFKDARAERVHSATYHVKKFASFLYPRCTKGPLFQRVKTFR